MWGQLPSAVRRTLKQTRGLPGFECYGDIAIATIQVMANQHLPAAIITVIIFISTNSAEGQSTSQSQCLSYEPAVVTLSGTLARKTFPGPPNYESIKKGDRPETSWFLDLPESVCVNEDKAEPGLNPKQSGIREIQLVLQPEQYQQHKGMLGRKVLATGTLFDEQ